MFILCNNYKTVAKAISIIKDTFYLIILDCEGRDLGCVGGALSLISVGTPHAEHIFLFDVVCLSARALVPLFDLLSGTQVMKVVWSGRKDFSELFFGYGVELRSVLDLQIADIHTRDLLYPGPFQRIARLSGGGIRPSQIKKLPHEGIHHLCGMDDAIREHAIRAGLELPKNAYVTDMHKNGQSEKWMERPLEPELLEYAANDVRRLAHIRDHFVAMGYLELVEFKTLMNQSQRFVSIHRDLGRPPKDDKFRNSRYLPVNILPEPVPGRRQRQCCDKCLCAFIPSMFAIARRGKRGSAPVRLSQCRLCYFLIQLDQLKKERQDARENAKQLAEQVAQLDIS